MKQFVKFGHEHTCTCHKNKVKINQDLKEIIGCDYKNKTKDGFKGYLWYKTKCDGCGGTILLGESYADYRIKKEGLLLSAIQTASNNFSYQVFDLLTKQFFRGKHFQGRFF